MKKLRISGAGLLAAREERGMTRAEVVRALAKKYGIQIAAETLWRWEHDKTAISALHLEALIGVYLVRRSAVVEVK